MDWKEEPATHQQLLRLQEYGFEPTCPLTVTQAARLIRQHSKHPRPAAPKPSAASSGAAYPGAREEPRHQPQTGTEKLSETARMYAYSLCLTVHAAKHAVAQNPERPGVRADLHSTISARQQFWLDTCRDNGASVHALEFYQHFGARFFAPSWEEVQEVLDALDAAMPGWDKNNPELFFETLKLNFPSLLRHR